MKYRHDAVMPDEVTGYLRCRDGGTYIDGTLGGGGHTIAILDASSPDGRVIGIDQDIEAIEYSNYRLSGYGSRVTLCKDNFSNIRHVMDDLKITMVDGILLDLGVSSHHFDSPSRGFSCFLDAPLDMRMNRDGDVTAYDLINKLSEKKLRDIFIRCGERRWGGKIADAIVRRRQTSSIKTTLQLADLVSAVIPKRFQPRNINPATKVFLALRIEVNDEINALKKALQEGLRILRSRGRFVVISFHSLEDSAVKSFFTNMAGKCLCPHDMPECGCGARQEVEILTKRVVIPSKEEIMNNPRSRSAKLRAVEKV